MPEPKEPPPPKRPRGRPSKVVGLGVETTPEQVARNIFAAAKPPDPTKRRVKQRRRAPTSTS